MLASVIVFLIVVVSLAMSLYPELVSFDPELFNAYSAHETSILLLTVGILYAYFLLGKRRLGKTAEAHKLREQSDTELQNKLRETENFLKVATELSAASEQKLLIATNENEKLNLRIKDLEKALQTNQERTAKLLSASAHRPEHVERELVNLLSFFQEKGRLIDFLMEDIVPVSDEQIGRICRVIHQGCKEVLEKYFSICAVHDGAEGQPVQLEQTFDAMRYRLLGKVPQNGPYKGNLIHKGWMVTKITLPQITSAQTTSAQTTSPQATQQNATGETSEPAPLVIQPAEIEL